MSSATRPETGPFATAALFQVVGGSGGHVVIDAAIGGLDPGTYGPADLCKLTFQAAGCGETALDLTILSVRDGNNNPITGIAEDDGLLKVDTANPTVAGVTISRRRAMR